jgi:positive regulator of sigma E activity
MSPRLTFLIAYALWDWCLFFDDLTAGLMIGVFILFYFIFTRSYTCRTPTKTRAI